MLIRHNAALVAITGFSALTTVEGSLYIDYNPTLSSVAGLSGLLWSAYNINVSDNPLLGDISALCGASAEWVTIDDNGDISCAGMCGGCLVGRDTCSCN